MVLTYQNIQGGHHAGVVANTGAVEGCHHADEQHLSR
jgi:hypothetical protein